MLLKLLEAHQSDLSVLASVRTLRQVLERHYARSEAGQLLWRKDTDLPRAATALELPYDPEARHSNKHHISWTGYKVHFTDYEALQQARTLIASEEGIREYKSGLVSRARSLKGFAEAACGRVVTWGLQRRIYSIWRRR